jgi:hypothetical protein
MWLQCSGRSVPSASVESELDGGPDASFVDAEPCFEHGGCDAGCESGGCGTGPQCVSGKCACDADSCTDGQSCEDGSCAESMDQAVLFGGCGQTACGLSDTWTWSGLEWQQQNVAGPSGRSGHAMAALKGSMLLFGGQPNGASPLGDTWLWNGSSWTQKPVSGPPARVDHAMATLNGDVVLFGGRGNRPQGTMLFNYLRDTWTWDGTTWTQQAVVGPSPRAGAAMATLGGNVVLFGGVTTGDGGNAFLDDTWIWDGATWTQKDVPGPSPRAYSTMISQMGSLILFGGNAEAPNQAVSALGDTWSWDGRTWTLQTVSGPSPRTRATATGQNGTILLFGGVGSSSDDGGPNSDLGDTWIWSESAWSLRTDLGPSPRFSAAMAGQ